MKQVRNTENFYWKDYYDIKVKRWLEKYRLVKLPKQKPIKANKKEPVNKNYVDRIVCLLPESNKTSKKYID
jgi:hypothetical protein